MKVLVTGGAGFLGSHVVDMLVTGNHDVTVLDNLSTGLRTNVNPKAAFIRGDIRDDLTGLFQRIQPEVVIHLAAQTSVPSSMEDPLLDLTVNLYGTTNVMQASAKAAVRKMVTVSSAAVYGRPPAVPVTERTPVLAISPYGLSKLTSELYVQMLGNLNHVAYTIIRPANIYGPRQFTGGEGAVIPSFLEMFLRGQDPRIHGDGQQTRDFIYVSDVARALVYALDRADGLVLNIGSGLSTTIQVLWTMLGELVSWQRPPVFAAPREGDIRHSIMNIEAAQLHLGWHPAVDLWDGLTRTVTWWQAENVAAAGLQ